MNWRDVGTPPISGRPPSFAAKSIGPCSPGAKDSSTATCTPGPSSPDGRTISTHPGPPRSRSGKTSFLRYRGRISSRIRTIRYSPRALEPSATSANPGQQERLRHRLQDARWWVCGRLHADHADDHGEHGESEGATQMPSGLIPPTEPTPPSLDSHFRTRELSNLLRRETITPVTATGFSYWTLRNRRSS